MTAKAALRGTKFPHNDVDECRLKYLPGRERMECLPTKVSYQMFAAVARPASFLPTLARET